MTAITPKDRVKLSRLIPRTVLYSLTVDHLHLPPIDYINASGSTCTTNKQLAMQALHVWKNKNGRDAQHIDRLQAAIKEAIEDGVLTDLASGILQGVTELTDEIISRIAGALSDKPDEFDNFLSYLELRPGDVYGHLIPTDQDLYKTAKGVLTSWISKNIETATLDSLLDILEKSKLENLDGAIKYLKDHVEEADNNM